MSRIYENITVHDDDDWTSTQSVLRVIQCDGNGCRRSVHRDPKSGHQWDTPKLEPGWMLWAGYASNPIQTAAMDFCPTCAQVIHDLIQQTGPVDPVVSCYWQEEEEEEYAEYEDTGPESDSVHVNDGRPTRNARCSYCLEPWISAWDTLTPCEMRMRLNMAVENTEREADRLEILAGPKEIY